MRSKLVGGIVGVVDRAVGQGSHLQMRQWLLGTLACLALVGCGGAEPEQAAQPETVTVERTVPQDTPTQETPTTEPEASPSPSTSSDGDCVDVPDVEGEDHQLAQDTMQAAGLYNLTEEDASGQGRSLLVDRNWTVEEQSPAAGECVAPDQTIVLRSRKDFE